MVATPRIFPPLESAPVSLALARLRRARCDSLNIKDVAFILISLNFSLVNLALSNWNHIWWWRNSQILRILWLLKRHCLRNLRSFCSIENYNSNLSHSKEVFATPRNSIIIGTPFIRKGPFHLKTTSKIWLHVHLSYKKQQRRRKVKSNIVVQLTKWRTFTSSFIVLGI